MLEPDRTNRATCSVCGWTRILDHTREYRGGHTNPADGVTECHEMLIHTELDTRAPDPAWYEEEDPGFTPTWA